MRMPDGRIMVAVLYSTSFAERKKDTIAVFVYTPGEQRLLADRDLWIDNELSQRVVDLCGSQLLELVPAGTSAVPVQIGAVACPPPRSIAVEEENKLCFTEFLAEAPRTTMDAFYGHGLNFMPEIRDVEGVPCYVMYHGANGAEGTRFHTLRRGGFMTPERSAASRYLFPYLSNEPVATLYEFLVPANTKMIVIPSALFNKMCNTYGVHNGSELAAELRRLRLLAPIGDCEFLQFNYQSFEEIVALNPVKVSAAHEYVRNTPGSTPVVLDHAAIDAKERHIWDLLMEANYEVN